VLESRDGQPPQRQRERGAVLPRHAVAPGLQALARLGQQVVEGLVMTFRELDDRVDLLGRTGEQQGPQDRVLGGVMVVQYAAQQLDVVRHDLSVCPVMRRHRPDQGRQQGQLAPEQGVDRVHGARVGVRVTSN
jgi:hypothetical protein